LFYLIDSDVAAVLIAASIPQVFSYQPVKEIQIYIGKTKDHTDKKLLRYQLTGTQFLTFRPQYVVIILDEDVTSTYRIHNVADPSGRNRKF
jgi:hypothetical protein